MTKTALGALTAIAFCMLPGVATADGGDGPDGVRVQLGGGAPSGATARDEQGVRVWRGARSAAVELAGGERLAEREAYRAAPTVVVNRYFSRLNRLRTQGFYSGHPGTSRRFTQGFWSGPAEWRRGCW